MKNAIIRRNRKEEWSVLKYIGPTDGDLFGLTNGKNYYWPCSAENPVYEGVIDDEEFTSYLYSTDADLWELLEDPIGMAHNTIFGNGKGNLSKEEYADIMAQVKVQAEAGTISEVKSLGPVRKFLIRILDRYSRRLKRKKRR